MVLEYGWGPDDSPMVYLTRISGESLDTGKDHVYELEANIKKLFNTACDKAAEILQKNHKALVALLEHLLEYDVVTKQEMSRILEENGAVQESEPFMLISYKNHELAADMSTNGTGRFSGTPQFSASGF
uniref:Peptidase M41 domain-containing protein n=1 Tax=Picea sitchensis TaxID=3332 RepID=A9NS58_PICSI|nr:unknown [Picea sitchensis]